MLHFSHGVRQLGENVALQVQFCKVFQNKSKSRGRFSALLSQHEATSVNLCEANSTWDQRHTTTQSFLEDWGQESNSRSVLTSATSQLSEGRKELAGKGLHLIVSQRDNADVFWDTPQDLEHTVWERDELAVRQVYREKEHDYEIIKL